MSTARYTIFIFNDGEFYSLAIKSTLIEARAYANGVLYGTGMAYAAPLVDVFVSPEEDDEMKHDIDKDEVVKAYLKLATMEHKDTVNDVVREAKSPTLCGND
jgi:hypothetical protein